MGRERRVYVGNLPAHTRKRDIENLFDKFGEIMGISLKERGRYAFAFIEFADGRDADDAVRQRDNYMFDGVRIKVEFPYGEHEKRSARRIGGYSMGMGNKIKHSRYAVNVFGLPLSGSWQDLKDHMRGAGEICYADVFHDGSGIVEFEHKQDMIFAVTKYDGSKFRSHEGESSTLRVKVERREKSRSKSKASSPESMVMTPPKISRSRSRSRSPRGRRRRTDS